MEPAQVVGGPVAAFPGIVASAGGGEGLGVSGEGFPYVLAAEVEQPGPLGLAVGGEGPLRIGLVERAALSHQADRPRQTAGFVVPCPQQDAGVALVGVLGGHPELDQIRPRQIPGAAGELTGIQEQHQATGRDQVLVDGGPRGQPPVRVDQA